MVELYAALGLAKGFNEEESFRIHLTCKTSFFEKEKTRILFLRLRLYSSHHTFNQIQEILILLIIFRVFCDSRNLLVNIWLEVSLMQLHNLPENQRATRTVIIGNLRRLTRILTLCES